MNNILMARIAGIACLLSGLLFFLDFTAIGWLARNGYFSQSGETTALIRTILWCVTSLFLTGGSLGLIVSGATGMGWQRKLSYCGAVWTLLGATSYIAGSLYIYNFSDRGTKQFFTPLGSLLITIGMLKLATAVVSAKVWRGWRRFVVVPVALYFPLQLSLQIIFFLGAGRGPNPFLLGVWGLGWMLLGFAIWSSLPAREYAELIPEKV